MKKVRISILTTLLIAAGFVISSCGEDTPPGPSLSLVAGTGYVSEDGDIDRGSSFKIKLSGNHDVAISTLKVRVMRDGGSAETPANCTLCDTTIDANSFTVDFENTVADAPGTETWEFSATDVNGNVGTKKLVFNRIALPRPTQTVFQTLGNQESKQIGNCFDLSGFNIIKLADAGGQSENIDIICVKDSEGVTYLGNAGDSKISGAASEVSGWATKNNTMFRKTTYSVAKFGAMSDSEELLAEFTSQAPKSGAVEIASGDIIYVQSARSGGRIALVKIGSIGADNTLAIEVLVEK